MPLLPEQRARETIDRQLTAAGWKVQRYRELNLHAGRGIAATELPGASGPADYLLYVDRKAQGVKANALFFDKRAGSEKPWTKQLWIYDLRTNMHFTLKTNPLQRPDLDEFVACYNPANRHQRKATWTEATPDGRWRAYPYDELVARDKASLDIFWLRDESLADSANLPDPDVIAGEIIEDLRAALEEFEQLKAGLAGNGE